MRITTRVLVSLALVLGTVSPPSVSADGSPPFIPAAAGWLQSVNYYRAMAGLPGVTEEPSWSQGALNHSCYMLENGITHDEDSWKVGYTASGDTAGNNGNVAVSSATGRTERSFVELWMTGPFHAIGMLRQGLTRMGYGQCERSVTPTGWHSGATLNILSDPGSYIKPAAPILFPGNGTVTSLDRFIAESPSPVTLCGPVAGWPSNTAAGLPVVAMLPEDFTSQPTATMYGPSGAVQVCVLSRHNTGSNATAQSILAGDNAVTIVPRATLAPGTYTVNLQTSSRSISWSFTVDPAASDMVGPPPQASPTSAPTGWQPITPARFVDSRSNLGATRLLANTIKRVKLTGRLGLPSTATAISANFTATATNGNGYLTVWNCSNPMPNASTLNFGYNETVPNAATIPLDPEGYVCLFSPVMSDLIIDVFGYYSTDATSKFTPVVPDRVMDTRNGLGVAAPGRLAAGQTLELAVPNAPVNATGVMLNVTSVNALSGGYITVYPCGARPPTSNVNQVVGTTIPNTVTTALSAARSTCIYTSSSVDLIVDVFGYMAPSGAVGFTPSAPFRWMDTRMGYQPAQNFGTFGARLTAGRVVTMPIAGQRGVPGSANAVSFNITVVDGAGNGGYITAFPCGGQPPTSNHNFGLGKAVANGATVALSASGELCLYSSVSTHVIIDVNGWWG